MALVHVSTIIYNHLQEALVYSKHTYTRRCCNGILATYFTICSFTKLCANAVSFSIYYFSMKMAINNRRNM